MLPAGSTPIARKVPLVPYAEDTEKLTLAALEKSFESARDRRVDEAVERKLQSAAPLDVADLLPHLQARAATVTATVKAVLGTRGRQEAGRCAGSLKTSAGGSRRAHWRRLSLADLRITHI